MVYKGSGNWAFFMDTDLPKNYIGYIYKSKRLSKSLLCLQVSLQKTFLINLRYVLVYEII